MELIDRQAAIDALSTWDKFGVDERGRIVRWRDGLEPYVKLRNVITAIVNTPPAQPEIIRCKDCKHNPKLSWFGCPMSHLSEAQRPETAWCWKAERREVTE